MDMSPLPKGNILIVDDTPDNLRLLSAMLTDQAYDVRSVKSGSAALMVVKAEPPDLILLDINMAGMNGYEVCQHLKTDPNSAAIPIIFISALNEVFDKIKAFSVGGVDYISKPFQLEEVLVRVENQLSLHRLRQQLQDRNQQLQQTDAELRRLLQQAQGLNQRIEQLAAIAERNRIARDIHDSLGHALVALNMQMEMALDVWEESPTEAHTLLQEAKDLGSDALRSVRESVAAVRTDPLKGQALDTILTELTDSFQRTASTSVQCQLDIPASLSPAIGTAIYRVVQEGLTNIQKHAAATAVNLCVECTPDGLRMTLQDNGKGFTLDANRSGFGLQGMEERVVALGGHLQIVSQPQTGCQITALFSEVGRLSAI
ncbi:response regulator [filamentous cyanobacterium LEGE 11480]|uniref:histidine kinase n=1 Tax=Romeriopsis navalis LEGE 11480 TaxID=2777977 RepID=A0A928Z3F8_9CYAN|nr:response regulator [Romeriopsis navalis]MBE9030634.1 response regulator [Romeriopsis navalis LEGE 11480]